MEAESEPGALTALSHELRTPLAAIAGYAEAMRAQAFGPLEAKYVEVAEILRAAAAHMLALVEDMARLGRAEEGRWPLKAEAFDAREAADEVLRLLDGQARDAGVRLAADFPEEALAVRADARAVRQILINLLTNALTASPRGGEVRLSLAREGGDLVIGVDDEGPGVTPGAAPSGEGVGLKLARALVALHGGEMSLANGPVGGARARVRLPVVQEG